MGYYTINFMLNEDNSTKQVIMSTEAEDEDQAIEILTPKVEEYHPNATLVAVKTYSQV